VHIKLVAPTVVFVHFIFKSRRATELKIVRSYLVKISVRFPLFLLYKNSQYKRKSRAVYVNNKRKPCICYVYNEYINFLLFVLCLSFCMGMKLGLLH
jgi:hypothetical protein